MNSTEVRLKQFKPAIKGLWKVWHEPLFFEVLQISYKVHEAHCTEEAICKNSRNFRNVSVFSFKKQAFSQKMGAVMPIVWSLITIVIDPPFWHPSPLEMLLIPQENSLFISTFNVVKKALPLLSMLFNNPHFWKGIVIREGKRYNWIKLSISSSLANS